MVLSQVLVTVLAQHFVVAFAYFDRGTLYLSQERFDEALDDFNQAVKLDPRMEGAYFNRAVCYFRKKEYAKVWADVHKIQRTGEELPEQFLIALNSKMQEPQTDPSRAKGLLVFFVPRQIAQPMNMPGGFSIKEGSKFLSMPEAGALIDFFLKQGKVMRENGLWIIGADRKIYSIEDKRMEEKLEELCRQKKILLFKTTTKAFPEGWKRLA